MDKQFVTYELAVGLRDIGFDERCFGFYWMDTRGLVYDNAIGMHHGVHIQAPLWQQVIEWFKVNHDIHIQPNYRQNIFGAAMFYEYLVHHKVDGDWKQTSISAENPIVIAVHEAIKLVKWKISLSLSQSQSSLNS